MNPFSRPTSTCITLATGISLLGFSFPELTDLAQYDSNALDHGQVWRLLSGHFTHWTLEHLVWNLGMFGALVWAWPRHLEQTLMPVIVTSAITISVGLRVYDPGWVYYRGLSGIDSALFVFVAIAMAQDENSSSVPRLFAVALLLSFGAKLGFEAAMDQALFVRQQPHSFDVVPFAHAVGGTIGVCAHIALWVSSKKLRWTPSQCGYSYSWYCSFHERKRPKTLRLPRDVRRSKKRHCSCRRSPS